MGRFLVFVDLVNDEAYEIEESRVSGVAAFLGLFADTFERRFERGDSLALLLDGLFASR